MSPAERRSSYLDFLPADYRDNAFLGRFLLAFEQVLSANEQGTGLEEQVAAVARYARPRAADPGRQAPADFLPWLASWVALTLREDWREEVQRRFIQRIVSLYPLRGTKSGLRQILEIYLGHEGEVEIVDDDPAFPPYYFEVIVYNRNRDPRLVAHQQQVARAIIEQEKPAHTYFTLHITTPTLALPFRLGTDEALLGTDEF